MRGAILLLTFLAIPVSLVLATMERIEVGMELREAELENHDTNILLIEAETARDGAYQSLFECAEVLDKCEGERHTMAVDCVKACAGCPEITESGGEQHP